MPDLTTIDDLLNKDSLDNSEEEAWVAKKLRQDKRGQIKKIEIKKKITVEVKEKSGGKGKRENQPRKEGEKKEKPQAEGEGEKGGEGGKKPEEESGQKPEGEEKPGGKGEREEKPGEKGEGGEKPAGENKSGGKGEEGEKPEGENKPGEKGGVKDKPREKGEGARGQPANLGSDVDSRLMAGQLREEKNKEREKREAGGEKGEEAEKSPEDEEAKEGGGLGGRIRRLKEKANLKEKAKKKIGEKVTAPAKQGTNRLLRNAWIHLIDSWGATLLYIDLHVFLWMVLGEKLFCKLGEEWMPKQIQAAGGEAGKATGEKIGLVESAGCCLLNLLALIIILVILALILLIADVINNPLNYIWKAITGGK